VARAWGRYHEEKAAAAAAEAERLAAREAAGLTGDFDIDIATDPDEVAANHTAATEAFGEEMGSFAVEQLFESDPGDLFHGDLDRGMDLTLGGETVPNKPENENLNSNESKQAVGRKADDMFAGFLTKDDEGGPKSFANLTPEEQQQIRILEALCCQRRDISAEREGRNSILGSGHNAETYDFPDAQDPPASRKCTVTKNENGDFVIDYSGTVHRDMVLTAGVLTPANLDPNTSVQTVSAGFIIGRDELARLGRLTIAGVSVNSLPEGYKVQFLEKYLQSTLSLNKPKT
jgi:hypothetical protein